LIILSFVSSGISISIIRFIPSAAMDFQIRLIFDFVRNMLRRGLMREVNFDGYWIATDEARAEVIMNKYVYEGLTDSVMRVFSS